MPQRSTVQRDHPSDDLQQYTVAEWNGITLRIKKRFPMFGFMRKLEKNPVDAIAMILDEESLLALENADMDMNELDELIGVISKNLGAGNQGN